MQDDNGEVEEERFSDQLDTWLKGGSTTLGDLLDRFGERSFAVIFAVLMALPAVPLPTGGASHVLEIVNMLIAAQLIFGRREVWLPKRFQRKSVGDGGKLARALLRLTRWLERFSRPRFSRMLHTRLAGSVFGLLVFGFTLTAFLAPPFSGLDTVPSMGVVVLSLGFLLGDAVVAAAGAAIGTIGVAITVTVGKAVADWIKGLF